MSRTRVKSNFWKGYFIYLAVIAVLLLALFFHVRSVLIEYENNSPEKYAVWAVENSSAKDGGVGSFLEEHCFEGSGIPGAQARKERYNNLAEGSELTSGLDVSAADSLHPVYNIYADGKPFMKVGLCDNGSYTKLGILALTDWSVDYAFLCADGAEMMISDLNENGSADFTLNCPAAFTALIDGEEYEDEKNSVRSVPDEFSSIATLTEVPEGIEYSLKGLYFEPSFAAVNDIGSIVAAVHENGCSYRIPAEFSSTADAEKLGESVNALERAELWSKLMTDDVGGTYHGFYNVVSRCGLVEGTDLYKLAYNWSRSVDITFVSGHRIDSFSGEKVGNFIKYGDRLFSCDVYFEKNMTLVTAAKRTDVFDNRLYFVYLDDEKHEAGWYLAEMMSLEAGR